MVCLITASLIGSFVLDEVPIYQTQCEVVVTIIHCHCCQCFSFIAIHLTFKCPPTDLTLQLWKCTSSLSSQNEKSKSLNLYGNLYLNGKSINLFLDCRHTEAKIPGYLHCKAYFEPKISVFVAVNMYHEWVLSEQFELLVTYLYYVCSVCMTSQYYCGMKTLPLWS